MGSHAASVPKVASILGVNSTEGSGEADTKHHPYPFLQKDGAAPTYSLLQWTPCCYSFLARYMHAKCVSLVEEAIPHLAEPHAPSRALSSHECFPLVRVWSYTQ